MTMTMRISSKSLSSLPFPSPEAQASVSLKPQNPNHISLKPSTFSTPFLETKHTPQHSSISQIETPFCNSESLSVAFPGLAYARHFFFKSAYNVQVVVSDREPEEGLVERFRRSVLRAGVIQEAKRRRFFETPRDKKKRKAREAAKRNRKSKRFIPKASKQGEKEQPKGYDFRDDNWEITDVQVPYC